MNDELEWLRKSAVVAWNSRRGTEETAKNRHVTLIRVPAKILTQHYMGGEWIA
jgi:hypothetical protein